MGEGYCIECFWLESRRKPGGFVEYWCGLDRELLGRSVAGRPACGEFESREIGPG